MSVCERLGVGRQQIVKNARLFFSIGVSRVPGNPHLNRNVRLEGNDDFPAQPGTRPCRLVALVLAPCGKLVKGFELIFQE